MGTNKMGSLLWEQKMGSLVWEHTKWVHFCGNIQNGFSSVGTDKMGSLLREQSKWVLS
jgi:hypothetical protein